MSAPSAAAGSQPHALPRIINAYRSPNFTAGREGQPVKYLVLHDTETRGDGNVPSLPWFLSTASGVSIHHLIGRDGTRYDLVQRADTAYHCGTAAWQGDSGSIGGIGTMNLCSLGMEFESSATAVQAGSSYTDEQLWSGAYTQACSLISYTGLQVLTHAQIALPAGRRHDPSFFPWDTYTRYVAAWLTFLRAVPPVELPHYCL